MQQPPPPPPVPNVANIQAAVNGMTAQGNNIAQDVQAYIGHQQALNTELSRCGNYNVAGINQQLHAIRTSITDLTALISAQNWNLTAQMQNAKVNHATGALVSMRSVEPGANPQIPINQPIPNFPATPDALSDLSVNQLRDILRALDKPLPPPGGQGAAKVHRTAVRGAIGLSAL